MSCAAVPLSIAFDAFCRADSQVAPEDSGPAVVVNTWECTSVERWIFSDREMRPATEFYVPTLETPGWEGCDR